MNCLMEALGLPLPITAPPWAETRNAKPWRTGRAADFDADHMDLTPRDRYDG